MDSDRSKLAYALQTLFGIVNVSPAFTLLNFTSEELQHVKETVQSAIIRPDGNVLDKVRVGDMANGAFSFELIAAGAFDWLFRAAMMAAPVIVAEAAVAVDIVAAAQTMTIGSGAWAVTPLPGQYLRITSAVAAGNNGVKRVVSATTTVITFAPGSLTDDATADSVGIKGTAYKNGMTQQLITLERSVTDGTDTFYQAFDSCLLDELSLDITSKQITKGSAKWMGRTGDSRNAILGGATYAAANTAKPMNATTHVGRIERAGVVMTQHMKSLNFATKRNIRGKDAVKSSGPFGMGMGKCEVTGSFDAYFEDKTLLDAFLAHDYASLGTVQTDPNNNSICVFIPSATFDTGNPKIGGENQDVMQKLDWQGIYDAATDASIVITVITP